MLMVSASNGVTNKLPPDTATSALWAVMIVISFNFLAGILVHLVDPKHQKHMAVESAKDRIHAAVHAAIGQRANEIAPRVADRLAAYFEDQVVQEMTGHIPVKGASLPAIGHSPVAKSAVSNITPADWPEVLVTEEEDTQPPSSCVPAKARSSATASPANTSMSRPSSLGWRAASSVRSPTSTASASCWPKPCVARRWTWAEARPR